MDHELDEVLYLESGALEGLVKAGPALLHAN
jgi:hypothetical protein